MPERNDERLDSWKEIANYLNRDIGTVIRWEKERGLPIYRAPGGKRKVIFAYRREIDTWLSGASSDRVALQQESSHLEPGKGGLSLEQRGSLQPPTPTPLGGSITGNGVRTSTVSATSISPLDDTDKLAISAMAAVQLGERRPKTNRWLYIALFLSILATLGMAITLMFEQKSPEFQFSKTTLDVPETHLSQYDFEDGEQGWVVHPKMMISKIFSSDAHHWQGNRSLAVVFDGVYTRKSQIYVVNPPVAAGRAVTAHVWCPAKNQLEAVALFVEDRDKTWSNDWQAFSRLIPGSWNKLVVRIPSDAVMPLSRLGFEFTAAAPWKGTCYVDMIDW